MIRPREIRSFPAVKDYTEKQLSPNDEFFYAPYLGSNQTMVIIDLLDRIKPKRVLEYGAGYSTVFFPSFFPSTKWIAIEHNDFFTDAIKELMPDNVSLYIEPIHNHYVRLGEYFKNQDGPFDFIFVDGERRPECIELAPRIMNDGAVILMHDAPTTDEPIMVNGRDVRENFREHGLCHGLWWARR
jgi:predicted O-methyltransferase YrrM